MCGKLCKCRNLANLYIVFFLFFSDLDFFVLVISSLFYRFYQQCTLCQSFFYYFLDYTIYLFFQMLPAIIFIIFHIIPVIFYYFPEYTTYFLYIPDYISYFLLFSRFSSYILLFSKFYELYFIIFQIIPVIFA